MSNISLDDFLRKIIKLDYLTDFRKGFYLFQNVFGDITKSLKLFIGVIKFKIKFLKVFFFENVFELKDFT